MAEQLHPYYDHLTSKYTAPYEARQVFDGDNVGFFVRVDIPGVPDGGVRVYKDPKLPRLIFIGRAPEMFGFVSERIYGFSVLLDKQPDEVDMKMTVRNGCLRLFFPGIEGILEPPAAVNLNDLDQYQPLPGSKICYPCEGSWDFRDDMLLGQVAESRVMHMVDCTCECDPKRQYDIDSAPQIKIVYKHDKCGCLCPQGKDCLFVTTPPGPYNNPFLMQGDQGVWESACCGV